MRLRLVYRLTVSILAILSLSLFVPLVYSLYIDDGAWKDFLVPLLTVLLLFLPSLRVKFEEPSFREALLSVVLIWFLFPAVVASVYLLGAHISDPVDAYFESVSGFTTTGATILNDIESLPPSVLLWRSLTQWVGGIGFVVFSLSVLPFLRASYHLLRFEASKIVEERISPDLSKVVKTVSVVYLLLTLAEVVLLKFLGLDWFQAINHALTTVSTGGFSPKNGSVAAFHSAGVEIVISLFMFLGSLNLVLYYRAFEERKPLKVLTHFETLSLGGVILVSTLLGALVLFFNHTYGSFLESLRFSFFQMVSAATTTGFASADFSLYPPFFGGLMLLTTFLGGSSGSTAGGIKQFRFLILSKVSFAEIEKTVHPRRLLKISLGGKVLERELLYGVLAFTFIYSMTGVVFGLLLTLGGHDLITSLSASVACLTSFGPGLGEVGPMNNFEVFDDWQKLLLSFEMVLGRLEVLPVFGVLSLLLLRR